MDPPAGCLLAVEVPFTDGVFINSVPVRRVLLIALCSTQLNSVVDRKLHGLIVR